MMDSAVIFPVIRYMKNEFNQSLESTSIAVTDRAVARSAPAMVAAHL